MITLTIDWEDFGQLFGKYHHGQISEPVKGVIERQTDIVLNVLAETNNKATFFILGMLAKYRPNLLKKIASSGHEISIHGEDHQIMSSLSPEKVRRDIEDAYKRITDIIGNKVHGYRAPFFSINRSNLFILEILSELGIIYDSSIFPVKLSRYGIDNFDAEDKLYKLPNGKEIVELPLTVFKCFGKKWPVAGGGYIRLTPNFLINKIFDSLYSQGINSMIYMHPYEFDSKSLDVSVNYPYGAPASKLKVELQNFRWNLFRGSVKPKIKQLLTQYKFNTCLERAINVKNNTNSPELLA